MKLKAIIETLNKTSDNKCYVDVEGFIEEFGIQGYITHSEVDERLSCYWVENWLCTDTTVGTLAYFFDDTFVCITHQEARKAMTDYSWVSKTEYDLVKNFFLSLLDEDDINLLDLEEDWGEYYQVTYGSGLQTNDIFYRDRKGELRPAVVTKTFQGYNQIDMWDKVVVKDLQLGHPLQVNLEEVFIPYNTTGANNANTKNLCCS